MGAVAAATRAKLRGLIFGGMQKNCCEGQLTFDDEHCVSTECFTMMALSFQQVFDVQMPVFLLA